MHFNAFFHYLLVASLLFASSFSAFHSSEHVYPERTSLVGSHLFENWSTVTKHESPEPELFDDHSGVGAKPHHDTMLGRTGTHQHQHQHRHQHQQNIEQLCETCLLLSSLTTTIDNLAVLVFNSATQANSLHYVHLATQTPVHGYQSRAPPKKA